MTRPAGPDNFEFTLTSAFKGYVSSIDPTNADPEILVRGSQNVYRKISGTIANRFGRKLYDVLADTTMAGLPSGFVWNNSLGRSLVLRVNNLTSTTAKLQVESSVTGTRVWYDLLTGMSKTRFVFDSWWDNTDKKDTLIFVRGDTNSFTWSGGMALFVSGNITVGVVTTMVIDSAGSGYSGGNVLTLTGGGANATATVNTVDASGAILTITLLNAGTGYSSTVGNATTGGGGPGATITTTVTTGIITLDRAAATAGFASSGSVAINGNTYSYTGISGSTLTGVGSDSSAEAVNSVVISKVVTNANTPAAGFTNDYLRVVNNQVYYGSYTSRLTYMTKTTSVTDTSQSSPRIPGDGNIFTLDDVGMGIGVRQGTAHIFGGTSSLYVPSFTQITVGSTLTEQIKVQKIQLGNLISAKGHEFIDVLSDNLIYLDQSNQLRSFGTFRNLATAKATLLSQAVQVELTEVDFTLGGLKVISDQRGDLVYVTAPNSGTAYIYQERSGLDSVGNVISERLWQPPQILGISRIETVGGRVIGFSNSNPQIYYLWDTSQWHDDAPGGSVPYTSTLVLSYKNGGRRWGKLSFDKSFYEGYAPLSTNLYGAIYFDYQGAEAILSLILNNPESPFKKTFSGVIPPSLGDASLGDNPLGDGLTPLPDDQAFLPKFKEIIGVSLTDCYEYTMSVYSTELEARWEILALGTNQSLSTAQAVEITK